MQLGGARGERVHEQQIARMVGDADRAVVRAGRCVVDAAFEVTQRVAPTVALVLHRSLHERDGRRLRSGTLEHDRAGGRRYGTARRALGQEAADLPLGVRAAAQPPIGLQE